MLMREATRHIVVFIYWMAWEQAARGGLAGWLRGVTRPGTTAQRSGGCSAPRRGRPANDGRDFSATQASVFLEGFTSRSSSRSVAPNTTGARGSSTLICCNQFLPRLAANHPHGLGWAAGSCGREERV